MGETTGIEWADATWNPLVGCTKVSPGCDNCYAETFVNRFAGSKGFPNTFDIVTLRESRFMEQPIRWQAPKKIFVNSLSDLFHKDVPESFIAEVLAVMVATPRHTYQLLTKRHGRMRALLNAKKFQDAVFEAAKRRAPAGVDGMTWPLPNLWLGVSVEDQEWADKRVPALLETPAAVRWISAEPLLGPVAFDAALYGWPEGPALDWIVVGGESGAGSRPMDGAWVRAIRDECAAAGVPFLFKQWGSHDETGTRMDKKRAGRTLDGRTYDEYPATALV